ncbi:MAG: glutamine-hydrolyzing carbamoyl-phosphate synthase small subunit [Candidatus Caenarcaniphilales bacterium]|nr:glutamine-hydrolyzing carbamoyl-phosphate synthase small subunit [Candidatus Caenarcaniphilales bacterium]
MARLLLEDGKEFIGKSIGKEDECFGEIIFNTSMTGYQEILTDPSYAGQIITFTYPEIGNYGCNEKDMESPKPFARGVVIKNYSPIDSNSNSEESLEEFLVKFNMTGIYGIDTRALTKYLRDKGSMKAVIAPDKVSREELLEKLKKSQNMEGLDLASEVTSKESRLIPARANISDKNNDLSKPEKVYRVIAFDFGIKQNIINKLTERNCQVELVPANTSAEYVLERNPDGIFLSNGPGDPAAVTYAIETVKTLVEKYKKPIFGICLGHQILSLSQGAKTYKLKFGHKGANHPIKELGTGKIEIASHNHGFAVNPKNLPSNVTVSHLNINDDTVAGIELNNRDNVFSVQYHPEASPGPHDSDYLFDKFLNLIVRDIEK